MESQNIDNTVQQNEDLDPQKRSSMSRHFEEELRQRVVGQNEAVEALILATAQEHQGDALVIDRHRGEEGLVFLRDTEERPSGSKIDFSHPEFGTTNDCGSSSLAGVRHPCWK